jgi:diguanylate cyclase (GGDEF)-like protein
MNKFAMIVENDPDSASLFSHVLDFVGFETEIIFNGKQALNKLSAVVPILVLLDLQLSHDVSGEDILRYIRSENRFSNTHVIVITGYPNLAKTVENLADLILIKPVSMPQLMALVSRICTDQISETFFRNASYNALTGLPNRAMLKDRVAHAIERLKRDHNALFALLFLELKDIQPIRLIGEGQAGNHLLLAFVERLQDHLRGVDTIASIGEDKFAVLLDGIKNPDDTSVVVSRLQEELTQPYMINDQPLSVSLNIRIISSIRPDDDPEAILEAVDEIIASDTQE